MAHVDLELGPASKGPGAKPPEWARLGPLLFKNWLSPTLRRNIKYVPRTSHTNSLGWLEAQLEAQLAEPAGPVVLAFDPGAEYALSAAAGEHWTRLALAVLVATRKDFRPWFGAFGIQLGAEGLDLDALLAGPSDTPLVEVTFARKTFLVGVVRGDTSALVLDVDVGPRSIADLGPADRARLEEAARTGVCACMFCTKLRTERAGAAARKAPAKKARAAKKAPT